MYSDVEIWNKVRLSDFETDETLLDCEDVEEMLDKLSQDYTGYKFLLDFIRGEIDIGAMASALEVAFFSFEEYMSDLERDELLGMIIENFDSNTIRLTFGYLYEEIREKRKRKCGKRKKV